MPQRATPPARSNPQALAIKSTTELGKLLRSQEKQLVAQLADQRYVKAFINAILAEAARKPELLECTPASILRAPSQCKAWGLLPGPQGHVYLIPYKKELQVQSGYKGLLHLAQQHERVKAARAGVVYQEEMATFTADLVTGEVVQKWQTIINREPKNLVAAWCQVELASGVKLVKVLQRSQVAARARRSQMKQKDDEGFPTGGAWATDPEPMWCKSAVRSLLDGGTVPMVDQLARLIGEELEEEVEVIKVVEATEHKEQSAADDLADELGGGDANASPSDANASTTEPDDPKRADQGAVEQAIADDTAAQESERAAEFSFKPPDNLTKRAQLIELHKAVCRYLEIAPPAGDPTKMTVDNLKIATGNVWKTHKDRLAPWVPSWDVDEGGDDAA
jgi:recombination protein RecT